ncbi:xylose isomerase-like protein [Cytidiella melzeri]|nr:xylose isomerase-like protein [Cytidiella melzeri]
MPAAKRPTNAQDLDSFDTEKPPLKKPRRKAPKQQADVASSAESEYDLADFPTRVTSPWKFGPHVSAAGGVENAVLNAARIGATAFALFLKSQRKWISKDLSETSVETFKRRLAKLGYDRKHILPHGSYLVNLGNPDAEKREKSYVCFLDDLKRCEQLGLLLYNFHPGSTVGQTTTEASLSFVAECINRAHKEIPNVVIVIENMAGSGNVLGSKFSEIGAIIKEVEDKARVGVCLDTCHAFAAGYDIRTKDGWEAMMSEFTEEIGIRYLRGMHINDSKGNLGSGKDRHQNLGLGHLGLSTFAHILSDPRTKDIPLILETPTHDSDKAPKLKGEAKRKKEKNKPYHNTEGDEHERVPLRSEEWEVWKKEVEVLRRLASMGTEEPVFDNRERLLDEWTKEIESVVVKFAGVSPASTDEMNMLTKTTTKKQRQRGQRNERKGERKTGETEADGEIASDVE